MKKAFIYSDTAHSWIPNKFVFFLLKTHLLPFTFLIATQRSCPWHKKMVKALPKACLKDANWTKVAQLKHVDPCFTNSSPFYMGHNHLKRQPAPLLTTENFLNPWEKQLPNLHLLFLPFTELSPQNSVITDCLLVRAGAWHTICLCMGTPEHNSHIPGGAEIPGSSLWSGNRSPYRRFDTKRRWVSVGTNWWQNTDLAEGQKF